MSHSRYGWWGYIRDILARYPAKNTDFEKAAVEKAIEETKKLATGKDRLRIIEVVYFCKNNRKNLVGASLEVCCGEATAQRYHADFILLVAENFKCERLYDGKIDVKKP